MTQIRPSVTNPTIADIYQLIDENKIILRPDFQRKFVWTIEHQEAFIETILMGLPFPEIYVSEGDIDTTLLRTTRNVIDGQQRLTTIKNYIDGTNLHLHRLSRFTELDEDEKRKFLSYQIVMRDLGKVSEEVTREIFRRINLTKFKLDDIEIHNAVYDGEFIKAAKEVLDNSPLQKYGVLKESEFTRMADLHFILLVMSTIENGGYFAQDREVETNIATKNSEYPNKTTTSSIISRTFEAIDSLDLPNDSMWFRKSNFFTLVVEIASNIDSLPEDIKANLINLEDNVMNNKNKIENEFGKYYSYMYQATHGRTARITRAKAFRRHVLNFPDGEAEVIAQ